MKTKRAVCRGEYGPLLVGQLRKILKDKEIPDRAAVYFRPKEENEEFFGWAKRIEYKAHPEDTGYGTFTICESKNGGF